MMLGNMLPNRRFSNLISLFGLIALLVATWLWPISAVYAANITITVDRVDDVAAATACTDLAPADCSLRGAIARANGDLANSYTIVIPAGTYSLSLAGTDEDANATGDLDVLASMTLTGAGATTTFIQAGPAQGAGIDRVLHIVDPAAVVLVEDVTVRYGNATGVFPSHAGGGIFNSGTLTLRNTHVTGNEAAENGGGLFNYGSGTLTVLQSTISGNTAGVDGGGVQSEAANDSSTTLNIVNSTLSGNTSVNQGGAILLTINGGSTSILNLHNATVVLNSASSGIGGIWQSTSFVVANVSNSILLNAGAECNLALDLSTNNLVEDSACDGVADAVTNFDLTLADNGGSTPTHALLTGSNAVDSGVGGCLDHLGSPLTTDQRGVARPIGVACDIGALEGLAIYTVINTNDSGVGSLRQAILDANAHPNGAGIDAIHFDLPGAGPHTIAPLSALPPLTDPASIDGTTQPGASCAAWPPTLLIELDGSNVFTSTAFDLSAFSADGSTVRGLVINRFGIAIHGAYASNTTIQCNYLGVDPTGTTALGNTIGGVYFQQDSNGNLVGGPAETDRNLMAGNSQHITIVSFSSGVSPSSNVIQNNYIGTDATGTVALGGGTVSGVSIFGGDDNRVLNNVISGNSGRGVEIFGDLIRPALANIVQGNLIGLDASGAFAVGNGGLGIWVRDNSSGTLIGGAGEGEGNIISGNGSDGIQLFSTSGHTLLGNFIGTDISGAFAIPNLGHGVKLFATDNNYIGGPNPGEGNLISGNALSGVFAASTSGDGNSIRGNRIGTDLSGTVDVGNGLDGVTLEDSDSNRVGGTEPGEGNLISGNDRAGVFGYTNADFNQVLGNLVGTDASGLAALGNAGDGIGFQESANNAIGGASAGARNIVSGNGSSGVAIFGLPTNSHDNRVMGNYIGVNINGTTALPNFYGVRVDTSLNTDIGGLFPGEGNLISGNAGSGVALFNGADSTWIESNLIGTDVTGALALPNGDGDDMGINVSDSPNTDIFNNLISGNNGEGIGLWEAGTVNTTIQTNLIGVQADGVSALGNTSATPAYGSGIAIRNSASNNLIGGFIEGPAGNTIAYNSLAGVRLYSGDNNEIRFNSIYANGGLGIDLGESGPTPNDVNDPDSGANQQQNFPVLIEIVLGESTDIEGRLNATPSADHALDFYSVAACDESGFGEGENWVGSTFVSTDATGDVEFSLSLPLISPNEFLVATATDSAGNTSEFSQCAAPGEGNTSWTTALPLNLVEIQPDELNGTADQYIDQFGQSRWFKFTVQPGSQVIVTLTGLPANYDLTLYKDIAATYQSIITPTVDDLEKLSAEFAPDTFSPDTFSPDTFSPDTFSPDAFSPDTFSPDTFSPDTFSPDTFSPDTFSPDTFSPDTFSPDTFSPDTFSPDTFSPDTFSPDTFSPDTFSPDTFSPDTFSPDTFSPDTFSPDPGAYASAQTRSLIGVSAFNGTAGEGLAIFTWNNTGEFYVRVRGRDGAFSLEAPFHLDVTQLTGGCGDVSSALPPTSLAASAGGFKTILLTDFGRMDESQVGNSPADKAALLAQLNLLAARPDVGGVVVDVSADARVAAANAQADANVECPYAKNLVVESIKAIVDEYRAVNPIEYVVLIGGDNVIPFFRYPDQALLANEQNYVPPVKDATASQASLKLGYFLTQDIYGSAVEVSLKTNQLPIPDLPVGRLVETATEATTVVNAYLNTINGVVPEPTTALVTGYDFLEDAALAVQTELEAGLGTSITTLIAPRHLSPLDPAAWSAQDLSDLLLGSRHDLVYLAGHFSANSALAADYSTRLLASEVADSSANFTNAIIFSAGCHSGYSIVHEHGIPNVTREPDWPRAFAQKGALLIAGTGYQYGDTDFIEYSERLYQEFSHQLRAGSGPVAVGVALMEAKRHYLATTPDLQGIHEKALLEATIYGLPMLSVNLPAGRFTPEDEAPIVTDTTAFISDPGLTLGLEYADVAITPTLTTHEVILNTLNTSDTVTATYLSGSDGVATGPAEPALPLEVRNVTVPDTVLRGVGFVGGDYSDTPNILPLIGAATTELRGVHAPFLTEVQYPIRPWNVNYYGAVADEDGLTRLMLTPAQFISDGALSQTGIMRVFSAVRFRLFYNANVTNYSGNIPALAAPPTIHDIEAAAVESGGGERSEVVTVADSATFRLHVTGDPSAGIQEVWVTFSAASGPFAGEWQSFYLTQNPDDTTLWEGELDLQGTAVEDFYFIAQAVNGVGLVTMMTNQGAYYDLVEEAAQTTPPAPTSVEFNAPPTLGAYSSHAVVTATLTSAGNPVAGKVLAFALGAQRKAALTDANGVARVTFSVLALPADYDLRVSFDGDTDYEPSSDESPFTITKLGTGLTLDPNPATGQPGEAGLMTITLADAEGRPLGQKTLFVILDGVGGTASQALITDFAGRATLEAVNLPEGAYTVNAYFSGNVPLPDGPVTLTDSRYHPSTTTGTLNLTTANAAPVAVADAYATNANTVLAIAAPGVLANDSDAELDSLTALLVSGPAHGALVLRLDGSFVYTPTLNYHGPDSFRYQANDGNQDSNTVTVTLTVNNTPPVAVGEAYTTTEDTTLTIAAPGVLANDTDPELDPLTAQLMSGPAHGALALNLNGAFVFTPTLDFTGTDTFTYRANDGDLNSNVVTVTITVTPVDEADVVYGVHDQGSADSQFFTIDPTTQATTPLGPVHAGADIEGLDIHPVTGELYGTSGYNNTHGQIGWLFKIDRQTGALTPIGYTGGFRGVQSLSFRSDGTLWGWAANRGLVTINLTTGRATLVYARRAEVFGMTWDNAGQRLYLARGRTLYVYNPATHKIKQFANNLPGSKTEMLEFRPDGLMQVAVDGSTTLYAYNVATKALVPDEYIVTPYNDVEGLAWPMPPVVLTHRPR